MADTAFFLFLLFRTVRPSMLETLVAVACIVAALVVAWLTKRLGIVVRPGG